MNKKKVLMAESFGRNAFVKIGSNHYAEHFLREGYEVCWINHPVSPFHRLSWEYKKYADELKDKYQVWRQGGMYHKGILYYTPLTFLPYINYPGFNSKWVLRNNLRLTFPYIGSHLKKIGFHSIDTLWITNPTLYRLADIVNYKRLIFRISDDHSEFEMIPKGVQDAERRLVERADCVFVISENLMKKYQWAGAKIHFLPNGVDYNHFQRDNIDFPEEYKTIPGPRLIYVGSIAEWFDVEIIEKAAKDLGSCSFIIIGRPLIDLSRLDRLKNVFILGGRDYSLIPAYLRNADIGIIPFKRSPLIESVSPIKLYEYMASGLPVVSTKWKTLEDIASPALLAETGEEFIARIKEALGAGAELKKSSVRFAGENSWDNRFETVKKFL